MKRAHNWALYVVRCEFGVVYIGITNDMGRRWRQHNSGHGAFVTRTYPPKSYHVIECFSSKQEVEAAEIALAQELRANNSDLVFGGRWCSPATKTGYGGI